MARPDPLAIHIAPMLTLRVPPGIRLVNSPPSLSAPDDGSGLRKALTWLTSMSEAAGGSKFASAGRQPLPEDSEAIEVAPSEVLGRFIDLARHDAEDLAFQAFASRYGLLGLCEHELPASHRPRQLGRILEPISIDQPPSVTEDGRFEWHPGEDDRLSDDLWPCTYTHVEDICAWRYWATQMEAIVRVSTQLHRAGVPDDEEVAGLTGLFSSDFFGLHLPDPPARGRRRPPLPNDPEGLPSQIGKSLTGREVTAELKQRLSHMVDHLMRIADVRIGVVWPEEVGVRPSFSYTWDHQGRGTDLFQVLVVGLIAVLTGVGEDGPVEYFRCDHCGRPHQRGRAPKHGQRAYCDLCRYRGPKAAYRAKQKLQGEDNS